MGEVQRAVGPGRGNGHGGIEARVLRVESRMDALESTLADNRQASADESATTHSLLEDVLKRLGAPQNGPAHPATGLYHVVDTVSERVRPFESLWLQVKGGAKTLVAVSLPFGALIWFLAGSKISALLHG